MQQHDRLAATAGSCDGQAGEHGEVCGDTAAVQPPLQGGGVGGKQERLRIMEYIYGVFQS